ncbi:MAG: hypothetical protein WA961_14600 [Rhodanobacter sp.]
MNTSTLQRLQRRLDAEALVQLRAEAARLDAENEDLRERLAFAEDAARSWAEDATEMHLQLCELQCATLGITTDSVLVMVPA